MATSRSPLTGATWAQRYCDVRAATEELARPLSAEDQVVQSMPDVSPTKWHRAHTTWFFEEFVLGPHVLGYEPHHPAYRYLYNSYYEAVGERHPRGERGLVTRPGVAEITAYRRAVDGAMADLLDGDPPVEATETVELGLNHEQQHQELLLMDIKHVLSQSPLDPVYRPGRQRPSAAAAPLSWEDHPGGTVEIGHDGTGFAFDNEQPRHEVLLQPFRLATRPVTAGEWMEFIDDGGYRRPDVWLSDGWATVQAEQWQAPLYWQPDAGGWSAFTLGGRRLVHPSEPVCHLSYYEADAYARWAGARLPLEAEWEAVAASHDDTGGDVLDLDCLHPSPVTSDHGGAQLLFGGVWEWTASAYAAYPGFRPGPGAVGEYNGKFMVNQQVLRGGSCLTPAGHLRTTYRNFFPPAARWAFSGLRLATDAEHGGGS